MCPTSWERREARAGPRLLNVEGRRGVRDAPAHDLLELVRVLGVVGVRGRRLQTPPDRVLGAERTPPHYVGHGQRGHRLGAPPAVAGADQDQAVDEIRPDQSKLLRHESAERGAEHVGLAHPEMIQERHHVGSEVGDAVLEPPLPPGVEGDRLEVAGEGRNLLEPPPTSEAKTAYQDQGRPLAVDVEVYAGVLREGQRHHSLTTSLSSGPRGERSGRVPSPSQRVGALWNYMCFALK